MSQYQFIYTIAAMIAAVFFAITIFFANKTLNDKNPKGWSVLVSSLAAFPVWFLLALALVLTNLSIQNFAIAWFAANGFLFAFTIAALLSLLQYSALLSLIRQR